MSTGQLGRILRRVPALASCSSWTMFVAPSRSLTATPYVQTCHVTSSSGHRGLPSACGRARFSSSAGRAGGSVETEEDLYSILQVPRDADQREIKQAFYQSEHRCLPSDRCRVANFGHALPNVRALAFANLFRPHSARFPKLRPPHFLSAGANAANVCTSFRG